MMAPNLRPAFAAMASAPAESAPEQQLEHQFRGKPWPPERVEALRYVDDGCPINNRRWMPAVVTSYSSHDHTLNVLFDDGCRHGVLPEDWRIPESNTP